VISVKVWREPDYSGEWTVDTRGRVVLPRLGEFSVLGRTTESLTDSLKTAFRQYLNNPSIEITVQRRIAVAGEVGRPGLVLADPTITIGDLIALAGGITASGDRNKVMLLRGGQVIVSALGPGTVLQSSPIQSGDQIFVPQRSWLSRNGQIFIYSAVSITGSIIVALIVRR
jgi:polysaccharide export outer membrane protein